MLVSAYPETNYACGEMSSDNGMIMVAPGWRFNKLQEEAATGRMDIIRKKPALILCGMIV